MGMAMVVLRGVLMAKRLMKYVLQASCDRFRCSLLVNENPSTSRSPYRADCIAWAASDSVQRSHDIVLSRHTYSSLLKVFTLVLALHKAALCAWLCVCVSQLEYLLAPHQATICTCIGRELVLWARLKT
jgi:hypothetical protein